MIALWGPEEPKARTGDDERRRGDRLDLIAIAICALVLGWLIHRDVWLVIAEVFK